MKYLFIAKKFVSLKRGAWTISHDLAKRFPSYITLRKDEDITHIKEVLGDYDKVVLVTQVPHLYSFPVNFLSLYNTSHMIFIRSEHNESFYNSCTNGFYYYQQHLDINNYIPFIPDLKPMESKEERIGFYYRPYLNPDACKWFVDNYKDNDVPIMTMGEPPIPLSGRKNWSHTYDREVFWSNISTYIYPMSTIYVDPFPSSVVEAIQTGKEVLFPKLGERNYKDGVDDCIEVYEYDRNLFNFDNYLSFYTMVLHTGMNNYINRVEHNNFVSYLLSII